MSSAIGIENHVLGSGVVVRNGSLTAAVSTATNFSAAAPLSEDFGFPWRAAGAEPANTRALYRFGSLRSVLVGAAGRHNLGRHGLYRVTADSEYAERPYWETDGVDDVGTATGIAASADITIYFRAALLPQPVSGNTTDTVLLSIQNGAAANRLWLYARSGAGPLPYQITLSVFNFGAASFIVSTEVSSGVCHDWAIAYRNSDQTMALYLDGALISSTTAATSWSDTGAETLRVGSLGAMFGRLRVQDIRIVGAYHDAATVALYRAQEQRGDEINGLGAWHFLEGTGTTVADARGAHDMALTGGTWGEAVNHSPLWDSGVLEAWGQWQRRQALRLGTGVRVTSPVLGAAERSITLSGLIEIPADFPLSGGTVHWYGDVLTNAELEVSIDTSGAIVATSNRRAAGALSVTSSPIAGLGLYGYRAVLDGRDEVARLYLQASTASTETLVGTTAALDSYAVLPSCFVEIGDSVGNAGPCRIANVRTYSEVRLQADDPHFQDIAPIDTQLLAHLHLDGSVVDRVDPSRSYTVSASPVYDEISQTSARNIPAIDSRIRDSSEPLVGQPKRLWAVAPASVDVTEVLVEMWDPENADGYVQVGAILLYGGMLPTRDRLLNASEGFEPIPTEDAPSREAYRVLGSAGDTAAIELTQLKSNGEGRELYERLRAVYDSDPTLKIFVELDGTLAPWQNRAIIGRLEGLAISEGPDAVFNTIPISVRGVK